MRQSRTYGDRVWRGGEVAGAIDAQRFALDAAQALRQQGAVFFLAQQGEPAGQLVLH